ncbi:Cox19p KNAG_0I02990 [Huiozyma naganishii CBS 8797]|uniref:CHCH domain-containing protein n=1 Tax=Huiozyma naganishii (strain ATCC MYA-139 / BCRC 22969 / CBS 8797 / KCTC 17520 / NBRC 10181 / NCYC 3082 / Yp74L-3) TaxID=1071383 RepID=J7RQL7_HUIN7|nr:hypothetical protein KNAG_0I02990 [Kazachstania naganishii CBS 8797]CCK72083.1 hypothetical protein KNAG_0I02990 [Kazachstania naganishii CBS 8797]
MSGNPGNALRALSPTPPERGSFPLDHDGECFDAMAAYLRCMRLVHNENAPNCRLLAKEYLRCRMEHRLMDRDDWAHLGLPRDSRAPPPDHPRTKPPGPRTPEYGPRPRGRFYATPPRTIQHATQHRVTPLARPRAQKPPHEHPPPHRLLFPHNRRKNRQFSISISAHSQYTRPFRPLLSPARSDLLKTGL